MVYQHQPAAAVKFQLISGAKSDTSCAGHQGGVFLAASSKTDMRVVDEKGSVLARVDAAGLQTYDAALSPDGHFIAAATFTADVKVLQLAI